MHGRCCKALPLHVQFRLGIFIVDVDNIHHRINFRACWFQNHLLSPHAWPSFRNCNGVRGKSIICLPYEIYTLIWFNQNAKILF